MISRLEPHAKNSHSAPDARITYSSADLSTSGQNTGVRSGDNPGPMRCTAWPRSVFQWNHALLPLFALMSPVCLKRNYRLVRGLLTWSIASAAVHGATLPPSVWPQFRGPLGTGVAVDATPPPRFGPTERVKWSVEVPWSPSSPIIWDDRIFLTTFREGLLETRCHDRQSGRLVWARGIKPENLEEFHRSDGSPAASTPATDGRHVVSYFGSFGLICHDVDGSELWRHPLACAMSGGQYGSGASPIIVGQSVLLNRDQYRYSSLLSVDLMTGKKRWETHRPDAAGSFGTASFWRNLEVDEIVLASSGRLKGYDLQSGAERWVVEGLTGVVCTTPTIADGRLYFAAWSNLVSDSAIPAWEEFKRLFDRNGDGEVAFDEIEIERRDYWRGVDFNRDGKYTAEDWALRKAASSRYENVAIALQPGGTGDISQSHVLWKSRRGVPYVSSPLFYDGRLYLIKDGGLLSALDAAQGEPHYAQEPIGATGNYYASPVAAAGHVYLASVPGKMTVVRAGGAKPEVVHQVDFGTRILATPALSGGNLFVRTATHL